MDKHGLIGTLIWVVILFLVLTAGIFLVITKINESKSSQNTSQNSADKLQVVVDNLEESNKGFLASGSYR